MRRFDLIEGPPEEVFWEKYNKRLEFPLSTVSAVLVHVLIGAVIVFGIFHLMDREADRRERRDEARRHHGARRWRPGLGRLRRPVG